MTKHQNTRKTSHQQLRSTAFIAAFFLSIASAPGAYSAGGAYDQLSSGTEQITIPAPDPSAAGLADQLPTKSAGRESLRIIRMNDEAIAATTPDQKIQMLKTLMRDSQPNNNNNDTTDWDQKDVEKNIMRILQSAQDAADFDYVYYRLDKGDLERSVGWYKDVRDLVNKYRGTVVPGDWDGLAKYVNTVAKAVDSGRNLIKFLIDGKDVMKEAGEALATAQKSIHIEIFQLQSDNIGKGLASILTAKAHEGVKVRVLIDKHGSRLDDDPELIKMIDKMRASGITILLKKTPFLASHLDHRKVVVIDGHIGFTGGMNIGRWYQVEWHDQQTLIVGPAVTELQKAFVEQWKIAKGTFEPNEDLFPVLEEYPGGSDTQVITHLGWGDQNIKAVYLRAIGTAQKSIRIANPYFTDMDVVNALRGAASRGVKVQVILPQDNDMAIVRHASRHNYPKMVKSGVQIYEYKGRMAHEKVAVIDGRWSTFGSSNLDERSFKNNDELNLIVTDPAVVQDIETRLFDADLPNCELMNNYDPGILDHMAHMVDGSL